MVRFKKNIIITLSLLSLSAHTYGRVVSHIEIRDTGIYDKLYNNENGKEQCKNFQPTKKQIISFFNSAKESKETNGLFHEYYSPCSATGIIKFKDGSSGTWQLESSGLSFVNFSNGELAVFFHRENKWNDPYACAYGNDEDVPVKGC
ncbi:hypothetical protein VRB95_05040 [Erwinia aphidicola]|uniref:hypothetical protein n=1 Tax=Erwinia aphidicola TaxID=68334 RepID=UPI0030CD9E55